MISCVFFDRDGIVNRAPTTRYVERRQDFHILEGFLTTLARVQALGYAAVIITNQKGVSTGATPLHELQSMHQHIRDRAAEKDLKILDIYYCDAPDESDPRRKPNPGMILEAAEAHGIDLATSWMIGDNEKDIFAGQRAGCKTILVAAGAKKSNPDFIVPDMDRLAVEVDRMIPPAAWRS